MAAKKKRNKKYVPKRINQTPKPRGSRLLNKEVLTDAEATNKLCNVMLNCQELVDDLEDLQEMGLFKQSLKLAAKQLLNQTLTQVDKIFGVGQKKVFEAMKKNRPKEEIDKLKEQVKVENKEMLHFYEAAMQPRYDFKNLGFEERMLVTRVIKDIREGNVKYVGNELYLRIQSAKELKMINNG